MTTQSDCTHPSVIHYWTDDLLFDPARCLTCGLAAAPDGSMLAEAEDDPAEREVFMAFTSGARSG